MVYRNLNLIQNKRKRISLTVLSAVPISCYLYFLSAHLSASPEEPVSRLWCCSFISFRNLGASDWNLRLVWWRWMFLLAVTHGINPSSINFMWQDVKLKMCWKIVQFFSEMFQLGLACAWLVLTDSRGSRRGRRSRGRAAASRGRRSLRGPSRGGTKSADTARAGRQRTRSEMCEYESDAMYLSELCEHEWEYEIIGILQTFVSEILKGAVFNLLAVFKSSSLFLLVPALHKKS